MDSKRRTKSVLRTSSPNESNTILDGAPGPPTTTRGESDLRSDNSRVIDSDSSNDFDSKRMNDMLSGFLLPVCRTSHPNETNITFDGASGPPPTTRGESDLRSDDSRVVDNDLSNDLDNSGMNDLAGFFRSVSGFSNVSQVSRTDCLQLTTNESHSALGELDQKRSDNFVPDNDAPSNSGWQDEELSNDWRKIGDTEFLLPAELATFSNIGEPISGPTEALQQTPITAASQENIPPSSGDGEPPTVDPRFVRPTFSVLGKPFGVCDFPSCSEPVHAVCKCDTCAEFDWIGPLLCFDHCEQQACEFFWFLHAAKMNENNMKVDFENFGYAAIPESEPPLPALNLLPTKDVFSYLDSIASESNGPGSSAGPDDSGPTYDEPDAISRAGLVLAPIKPCLPGRKPIPTDLAIARASPDENNSLSHSRPSKRSAPSAGPSHAEISGASATSIKLPKSSVVKGILAIRLTDTPFQVKIGESDPAKAFELHQYSQIFGATSHCEAEILKHLQVFEPEKKIQCTVCGATGNSNTWLNQHMQKGHAPSDEGFHCSFCKGAFASVRSLVAHFFQMHRIRFETLCSFCNQVFEKRDLLNKHLISKHGVALPSAKVCPICSKPFVDNAHMNDHMRSHESKRNFLCSNCGVDYKFAGGLARHQGECRGGADSD